MAKMPNYYKVHTGGHDVALEPIYEELVPVVRGQWEWKDGKPFCSVCKKQGEPKHHYEDGTVEEYNYCPNCGAKMDGGNDNGEK